MFRRVAIGISGGVDSAVAAFLLKQKGFNVLGVFMRNWDEFDELGRCSGEQDLQDASYACTKLGIELRQVNYVKDYWNSVFEEFLADYQNGLTPNPDILCNRYIKFDLFHNHALQQLNCDAIATGHYARTSFGTYLEHYDTSKDVRLLLPKDTFKDQTFFLSGIKRDALRRTMFPLDNILKSEVKWLAQQIGLSRLALKKESTGICFVGDRKFREFIKEYVHSKPGEFIDLDTGKVVGQHEGVHQWTLGQRCRLASCLQPYFVAEKHVPSNTIYVAAGHDHPALYSENLITTAPNWLCSNPFEHSTELRCRFRFQHTKPLINCTLRLGENGDLVVRLHRPLRAITPGQYAVFYSETECLGSARIKQHTSMHHASTAHVINS